MEDPHSFHMLDKLLHAQVYRLAFWQVAAKEINYRRFFDINELAAIRVEMPEVFHETHQLIFRLLTERKIAGLRIDHADGLRTPVITSAESIFDFIEIPYCYGTSATFRKRPAQNFLTL